MLQLEIVLCLISLALMDSSDESIETPVDGDAFMGSSGVASGTLVIRAIVL